MLQIIFPGVEIDNMPFYTDKLPNAQQIADKVRSTFNKMIDVLVY